MIAACSPTSGVDDTPIGDGVGRSEKITPHVSNGCVSGERAVGATVPFVKA
jgi:hypothetical protein